MLVFTRLRGRESGEYKRFFLELGLLAATKHYSKETRKIILPCSKFSDDLVITFQDINLYLNYTQYLNLYNCLTILIKYIFIVDIR